MKHYVEVKSKMAVFCPYAGNFFRMGRVEKNENISQLEAAVLCNILCD